MTVPNIITLARFLLVPLVVWAVLVDEVGLAFAAFLLAGVSDAVDGYIARRFDQHSELGAYLDPIADKALLVSTYFVLGYTGDLPIWLVVAVIARDLLILGGVILASMLGNPVAIRPFFVSKANTAAQIGLALVALGALSFLGPLPAIHAMLVVVVSVLTLLSGFAYLRAWFEHMRHEGRSQEHPDASQRAAGRLGDAPRYREREGV